MSILSHLHFNNYEDACSEIYSRIKDNPQLVHLFEQLQTSSMGRFLIRNRGLNAYWTDIIVNFPHLSPLQQEIITDFDCQILGYFPIVNATQQRFSLFKKEIAACLTQKMDILSAPAGLLPEFRTQDYTHKDITITALDIDATLEQLLKQYLKGTALEKKYQFCLQDVFHFSTHNQYDLVVSNGLNIYISDHQKVQQLYQIFFNTLKAGGKLITSFLTPPPTIDANSPWQMESIPPLWLQQQKQLFIDILDANWNCYMDESTFTNILKKTGFNDIKIHWDNNKIFPTVTACKV
ncbi:MAG: class I SAM-dependent methyltransferase [Endozoicomonadaceae bacterium]|nr:class I SAM-dependent methyltransferase [Endozoicomonadaceae bacterium]MCY4330781.1 class I SAM-dependent methyltransferase [Endozoicomonadaceae bacterium]